VDGLAWNFTASILNFRPNHSFGINYGRTDAGWFFITAVRQERAII
jgi:hypothetical protein